MSYEAFLGLSVGSRVPRPYSEIGKMHLSSLLKRLYLSSKSVKPIRYRNTKMLKRNQLYISTNQTKFSKTPVVDNRRNSPEVIAEATDSPDTLAQRLPRHNDANSPPYPSLGSPYPMTI